MMLRTLTLLILLFTPRVDASIDPNLQVGETKANGEVGRMRQELMVNVIYTAAEKAAKSTVIGKPVVKLEAKREDIGLESWSFHMANGLTCIVPVTKRDPDRIQIIWDWRVECGSF